MNGSHFALKYELVVGIDDDGLEVRVSRHQTQIAFVFLTSGIANLFLIS